MVFSSESVYLAVSALTVNYMGFRINNIQVRCSLAMWTFNLLKSD
jgi:hypothetical protein